MGHATGEDQGLPEHVVAALRTFTTQLPQLQQLSGAAIGHNVRM
jgi:hypothetical protein